MPSLRLHMLSAASEKTLCKRTHRSFDNALRLKAIQLEKRARQRGFSGHENRCLRDPIYTVNMNALGYPPEFCESILPEVIDYLVWVDGKPPAGKAAAPGGKGAVYASPKAPPPHGAGPKAGKASASGKASGGTKAGKASAAGKANAAGKATASQQHGTGGPVKGKASGKRGGKRA
jgi:hypothetical protein